MRYSIETRDQIYVKSYEFLSFAKNNGKNLRSKYRKKFLDSTKKTLNNRYLQKCFKKSNSKNIRCNWLINWN